MHEETKVWCWFTYLLLVVGSEVKSENLKGNHHIYALLLGLFSSITGGVSYCLIKAAAKASEQPVWDLRFRCVVDPTWFASLVKILKFNEEINQWFAFSQEHGPFVWFGSLPSCSYLYVFLGGMFCASTKKCCLIITLTHDSFFLYRALCCQRLRPLFAWLYLGCWRFALRWDNQQPSASAQFFILQASLMIKLMCVFSTGLKGTFGTWTSAWENQQSRKRIVHRGRVPFP